MTAKELAECLTQYTKCGHADDVVMVDLKEPSIGVSAGVAVEAAYTGFDWDSGSIRLKTDEALVRDHMQRDNAKEPFERHGCFWCKRCQYKVGEKDRYCRTCRQKLREKK